MDIPFVRIRQVVDHPRLADPAATVRRLLFDAALGNRVRPGGTIALAVGSRGVAQIALLVRSAVDALNELGYRPFVVAAMGSHGNATASGQRELLASYGVTAEALGVEVCTDMEIVGVGADPDGDPIPFDRRAFAADGIILINRIKPHTDFHGTYESGLVKMLTIGLGKREGANAIHRHGVRGLIERLPEVARRLASAVPLALGLAVIENARDQIAEIEAIPPEHLFEREPILLARARALMARLPFDPLDALIVGEIGKNYSGAGMDPNVIGRVLVETLPDLPSPTITRLVALDLSEESHGNAVGVGLADLIAQRLADRIDVEAMAMNVITACMLERARVPLALPTDRDVVQTALATCWRLDPAEVRAAVIPNTLELETLWVSPALAAEAEARADLAIESGPTSLPYDGGGQMDQEALFPTSIRANRRPAG